MCLCRPYGCLCGFIISKPLNKKQKKAAGREGKSRPEAQPFVPVKYNKLALGNQSPETGMKAG